MISSTHILGFRMLSKGGHKGQRRDHSLVCSTKGLGEGQEDEDCCIGRGYLGQMLSWIEPSVLDPCLFSGELPVSRRAHLRRRAHHQWGGLTPIRLQ
jgi:hypothetical protein